MTVVFDTAAAALGEYRRLVDSGLSCVEVHASDQKGSSRISARKLVALAGAEALPTRPRKRRLPKAIVGALLGVMATALPNSFGENLGPASGYGSWRAARTSRARPAMPG